MEPEEIPPRGSTVTLHVTQGRRNQTAQDQAKPTKPQNRRVLEQRCSCVSAEDPQAKKTHFVQTNDLDFNLPRLICVVQSHFIFVVKKCIAVLATNTTLERAAIQGLMLIIMVIFGGLALEEESGGARVLPSALLSPAWLGGFLHGNGNNQIVFGIFSGD